MTSNKEAIEYLIKYLKKNAKIEDLYRLCANLMIDTIRMLSLLSDTMSETDVATFIDRLIANAREIGSVVRDKGESNEPLKCHNINEVQDEWR